MIKPISVCAVIVTFNRFSLLKECIEAVLNQSHLPDKVIIVNNGSTDGTEAYLKSLNNHKIEIISQENTGGAGGFHTGIKKAYEQNYDWIWAMDDDVEPFIDCLEQLLKYTEISKCIHPLRINKDNNTVFNWEHYLDYRTCMPILHENVSLIDKDYCFVNTACFEGMLIHRSVVTKIGFPKEEYFIAGDDTEYGILANLHTNIMYTKTAKMYRKASSTKLRPLQAYYEFRNVFLLRKTIKKHYPPGYSSMFYNSVFKNFRRKSRMIIVGKEYAFKEKINLIRRMLNGVIAGFKIYKNK